MSAWWYWTLFVLAGLLFAAPLLATRWVERRQRKDRELWNRVHGGGR